MHIVWVGDMIHMARYKIPAILDAIFLKQAWTKSTQQILKVTWHPGQDKSIEKRSAWNVSFDWLCA